MAQLGGTGSKRGRRYGPRIPVLQRTNTWGVSTTCQTQSFRGGTEKRLSIETVKLGHLVHVLDLPLRV